MWYNIGTCKTDSSRWVRPRNYSASPARRCVAGKRLANCSPRGRLTPLAGVTPYRNPSRSRIFKMKQDLQDMSRISKRRQDFQDEVDPLILFIVSILSRIIGFTGFTG